MHLFFKSFVLIGLLVSSNSALCFNLITWSTSFITEPVLYGFVYEKDQKSYDDALSKRGFKAVDSKKSKHYVYKPKAASISAFHHKIDPKARSKGKELIYFHGNGANALNYLNQITPAWTHFYFTVVLVEYSRVTKNRSTNARTLIQDGIDTVQARLDSGISPDDIVLYGRSLGSGIAAVVMHYFAERGIVLGGLVIEAGYDSLKKVATDMTSMAKLLVGHNISFHNKGIQNLPKEVFLGQIITTKDRLILPIRQRSLNKLLESTFLNSVHKIEVECGHVNQKLIPIAQIEMLKQYLQHKSSEA